jgi:flagellar biosynthesis/type III secretory pathway M-ring protein FliF/YscJ
MRSRSALVLPLLALAVALVAPAQANAESLPSSAGNFVSDNIQYFVAGLVAAILLLLLVVSITQRRAKASTNKKKNEAGPAATPTGPLPRRPGQADSKVRLPNFQLRRHRAHRPPRQRLRVHRQPRQCHPPRQASR